MRAVVGSVFAFLFGCSSSSPGTTPLVPPTPEDAATPGLDVVAADLPAMTFDRVPEVATSADVAADRGPAGTRTVLRVRYPATDGGMALRGSVVPLNWERGVSFAQTSNNTWEWSTDALTQALEWKPLLDDRTWSRGPNYRAAPGTTVEVFPRFRTQIGTVSRRYPSFMSAVLNNRRGVWVYLPPSYEENTLALFPVVYMHDGQNVFDPMTAFGGVAWEADDAMNAGAENGQIREAIVVGVENTAARIDEYTPTRDADVGAGGRGSLYVRLLADELKPMIDAQFRTRPDPAHTAVVGSSLGGLISIYAGLQRPEVFGLVGAMSPSTWWDNRSVLTSVTQLAMGRARPLRVYIDSGDAGNSNDGVADTRELAMTFERMGYSEGVNFHYIVQSGATHTERYWAQRLPGALGFLLGPRDP